MRPEVSNVALVERERGDRCLQGDGHRGTLFLAEYGDFVKRAIARSLVRYIERNDQAVEVETISEAVFEYLFRDNYRLLVRFGKSPSIRAWLVTVVQEHVAAYVFGRFGRTAPKRRSPQPFRLMREDLSTDRDSLKNAVMDEGKQSLEQSRANLSCRERLIVSLFYVDGMKYSEISQILDLDLDNVLLEARRARMKLLSSSE